jgi:hypothetical protein
MTATAGAAAAAAATSTSDVAMGAWSHIIPGLLATFEKRLLSSRPFGWPPGVRFDVVHLFTSDIGITKNAGALLPLTTYEGSLTNNFTVDFSSSFFS